MRKARGWRRGMAVVLSVGMGGALAMTASAAEMDGYQVNEELVSADAATLNLYGPGLFANAGADGNVDLLSGIEMPGYNDIIARWNELYPNCEVHIDAIPWDSWQTNITTACMSGDVDIILHGATMTDLTEDLAPYLEKDPEYKEKIYQTASRLTSENMSEYKVSGVSMTVDPVVVWLDKQKFENFGVELPSSDWTYDDMLALAEKLTGEDPVTGEQTYGIQYYAAGENNIWANQVFWANSLGADIFQYHTNVDDAVVDYMCDGSVKAFQMAADIAQCANSEVREGVAVNTTIDGNNDWAMFVKECASCWNQISAGGLEDRYVSINMPLCTEGRYKGVPTPWAGDNNLAIYKDSKNKDWAWEFIKFMTTDDVAVKWITDETAIPNSKVGMQYVKEHMNDQVVGTLEYVMENMPENYNNATNPAFNNVSFGATTNTLITAVDNVINGYMTAEEAAQSMQDYVDEFRASGTAE